MTTIIRVVLAMLVLALSVTAVEAKERIPFVEGDLHGHDWEQIKKYLAVEYPLIIEDIAEEKKLDREAAWEYFRKHNMFAGRFDITGDGVEELFVTIFHNYVCGTAGCNTPIFQMSPSGWQELSSISPMISDIGGPEIFVADEVIDGYRTLHTDYMGLHWNGERYVAYCRRNCSQG
jgi:hypothetical protein